MSEYDPIPKLLAIVFLSWVMINFASFLLIPFTRPDLTNTNLASGELSWVKDVSNPKADEWAAFSEVNLMKSKSEKEIMLIEAFDGVFLPNTMDLRVFSQGQDLLYANNHRLQNIVSFEIPFDRCEFVFVDREGGGWFELVESEGKIIESKTWLAWVMTFLKLLIPLGGYSFFIYLVGAIAFLVSIVTSCRICLDTKFFEEHFK